MKHLRQLGLIVIIFIVLLPAIAQEPDFENQYDFGNNVFIRYPEGWETFYDEETDDSYIYSEQTDILILFEAYDAEQSLMDYLKNIYERTLLDSSQSLNEESVFIGELGSLSEITAYTYDDNADGDVFQRYIFAIPLREEIVVLVSVAPYSESKIGEIDTVRDILSTLQFGSDEAQVETETATEIPTEVPTETPEPATPTPVPTTDPSAPRNITWDNQLELQISADWVAETSDDGLNYIYNDDFTVAFFTKMIEDERQDTQANFLREVYHNTDFLIDSSIPFDEDLIFFVDLASDLDALGYKYIDSFEGEDFEQLLVAVKPGNTMLVVAVAYPLQTDAFTDADLEAIYDILGTLISP